VVGRGLSLFGEGGDVISVEKPGTPAELIHYGKKGMKWGVRNSDIGTGSFKKQFSTRQQRNAEIQRSRAQKSLGKATQTEMAVAKRLTSGEKAVATLLALSSVGTLPIAAFVGVRAVSRRRIEKEVRGS
jgi:hypothetical protein